MASYGGTTWEDHNDDRSGALNEERPGRQAPYGHISSASMPAQQTYNEESPLKRQSIDPFDWDQSQQQQQLPLRRRRSDPTSYAAAVSFEHDNSNMPWSSRSDIGSSFFPAFHRHWLPDAHETDDLPRTKRRNHTPRSIKRRLFLLLTEPSTSKGSGILFVVVGLAIFVMNIVMIMQTMRRWQYTPEDCITCGGSTVYIFEDDASLEASPEPGVPCVCPPTPFQWTDQTLKYLIYFFTVEWSLRVLLFEPPAQDNNNAQHQRDSFWKLWLGHLTDTAQILDALAIFPFYLESLENTNGLMSLRLLRLFRVFQLLRLGQYNQTFQVLTNVLWQSTMYLKLLMVVLVFGAALFGSLIYWLEKGQWQYHEESDAYRWMRIGVDGITEEPSPFTSIPAAFWWFMVTATTVGYGDVYPTTTSGKCCATVAMLTGVLVVAFPVSVFSDLWAHEMKRQKNIPRGFGDGTLVGALGEVVTNGQQQVEPHSYYSTRAKDVEVLWSSLHFSNKDTPNDSNDEKTQVAEPATVTIQRADLVELANRLENIRENEIQIRNILKKYDGTI